MAIAPSEAVSIGGNGLGAVGIMQALEEDLGIPAVTANQALFWHLPRLAGTRASVLAYGRLFARDLPAVGGGSVNGE